ncbi:MAG: carboxypeptidase regulatory-like domain-containing protein [Chloroflexi bacterium]|nr:carboxypeptidase regulatory-like domain-containing protein [Chloroflexota bacterium]
MMILRTAFISVLLAALLLAAPATAAEPAGLIQGKVENGTGNGGSVAAQEIVLLTYVNDAAAGETRTMTDEQGYFKFDNLVVEASYRYLVTTTYQQAEYGTLVTFESGQPAQSVIITVYESTTSDADITLPMTHTVLYFEPGGVRVKEVYIFLNNSDRTYIGSQELDDGRRETLRFAIPQGAADLQAGAGLMGIRKTGDSLVETIPVYPGDRQVSFSYLLPDASPFVYTRPITYPTGRYDLLYQGEGLTLSSAELSLDEPLDIAGSQYYHYSAQNLAAGAVLSARLSAGGGSALPVERPVLWVALALGLLLGAAAVVYFRRKTPAPSPAGSLEARMQALLAEMARLDDDLEAGVIPPETHRELRDGKKAELVIISRKLRGAR